MRRSAAAIALAWLAVGGCGELSSNPGVDAGSGTLRFVCRPGTEDRCVSGESYFTCYPDDLTNACAADEKCARDLCLPSAPLDCASRACNRDQTCVNGSCVFVWPDACDPTDPETCFGADVCDPELRRCVVLPACAADGGCVTGERGAVCNHVPETSFGRYDPERPEWGCLIGRCASDAHCPPTLRCQDIGAEHPGLGRCL